MSSGIHQKKNKYQKKRETENSFSFYFIKRENAKGENMVTIEMYKKMVADYQKENGLLKEGLKTLKAYAEKSLTAFVEKANARNDKNGPSDEEKVKEYLNSKLYQMLGDKEWIRDGKETFDFSNPASNLYVQQCRDFGGML